MNAKKIIECLRQINFTTLEDSVPKWKIGHPTSDDTMFDAFNVSSDDADDIAWNSMKKTTPVANGGPYYFITSQSFVHSQISKILPSTDYNSDNYKGFEARNEGDEDSSGIGEEEMRKGMEALLITYNASLTNGKIDESAQNKL